jgi:carbon storage regulator
MLVLTRKLEESVMIGSDVEVRVLGIHGDQVRIGFSAPRNVPIFRKEVFEEIHSENLLAARPAEGDLGVLAGSLRKPSRKE